MPAGAALRMVRSLPHGHVAAVLGHGSPLGLPGLLDRRPSRERDLAMALIAAGSSRPRRSSRPPRWLADTTLARDAGRRGRHEDELYAAMDWLLARQARVEAGPRAPAPRARAPSCCTTSPRRTSRAATARSRGHGHSRDHRPDRAQIVFGLLTDARGCPVAVEVFSGQHRRPGDAGGAGRQAARPVRSRRARPGRRPGDADVGPDRAAARDRRHRLGELPAGTGDPPPGRGRRPAAVGLFDERNLAEITSPEFPGERLVVCRNPVLAAERTRKREALLGATEAALARVAAAVERGRLRTAAAIGLRAGRVVNAKKVAKHFELDIADGQFAYRRADRRDPGRGRARRDLCRAHERAGRAARRAGASSRRTSASPRSSATSGR